MAIPVPVRPKLRTAFKKSRCIAPLYTSGPVAVTADGKYLVTCVGDQVLCTDITTGTEITRFATDSQTITSLCTSPSSKHIAIFSASLALRIYEIPNSDYPSSLTQPVRVIARAHDAPVHECKIDPTSSYLASGSADGVVKIWDILRGFTTHLFKGHGGVVSALAFTQSIDPSSVTKRNKMQLVTASVDTRIRIFDLTATTSKDKPNFKPIAVLEGHVSVPRGLEVSADGNLLVSGGRDSVVLVWDISCMHQMASTDAKGKGKVKAPRLVKTIPVLERVEGVGFLRPEESVQGEQSKPDRPLIYTGGQKGVVRVWDILAGKVVLVLGEEKRGLSEEQEEQLQILNVIYTPSSSTIISVHADQNILFHSITTASLSRQLIGFNDEIVDATFLSLNSHKDSHLALATNSSLIRIYSTSTLDSRLLDGHSDIVLSLDHSADGDLLASSSKDKTARLWSLFDGQTWTCVAVCEGHGESVGAVALSRSNGKPKFLFSGSQDRTIKMWNIEAVDLSADSPQKCKSLLTLKAHEKDINSLDVAPNDKLLASGSQDRTVNVYEIDYHPSGKTTRAELKLLGSCKGHKRGVWSVRFGRAERVLATGSGDKTIKLWNLDDFTCVKTFEGHTNSILRVEFMNQGMQLVSSASDGLVKIWNVREEDCMATLDNHEDKVWALALSSDERTIVSGSADSVVTFWMDSTEEEDQEKETKRQELVALEQNYQNYLALNDYRRAIELALAMEQPGRLFSLFKRISSDVSNTALTGDPAVDEVVRTMGGLELTKLLRFVRDWNANAKTSGVAQTVLHAVLKLQPAEKILKAAGEQSETVIKEIIDGIIPYSERHLLRLEGLVQESYIVDYILAEMDGMVVDDEMEID